MPDHLSEAFVEAVPWVFTILLGTFCWIIVKGNCFDRKRWQQEETSVLPVPDTEFKTR